MRHGSSFGKVDKCIESGLGAQTPPHDTTQLQFHYALVRVGARNNDR
jgi:hypothetical protein